MCIIHASVLIRRKEWKERPRTPWLAGSSKRGPTGRAHKIILSKQATGAPAEELSFISGITDIVDGPLRVTGPRLPPRCHSPDRDNQNGLQTSPRGPGASSRAPVLKAHEQSDGRAPTFPAESGQRASLRNRWPGARRAEHRFTPRPAIALTEGRRHRHSTTCTRTLLVNTDAGDDARVLPQVHR